MSAPPSCTRPIIADTNSVGYTQATGGSRVTYATGRAVIDACNKVIDECLKQDG